MGGGLKKNVVFIMATKATATDKGGKSTEVSEMLKAGVQFGHETKRWNPKMKKFIFTDRNNIHIIDISKTMAKLEEAVKFLNEIASEGEILFVGTKRQASDIVKQQAIESGSYYIVNRWPGGLMTNFDQIKQSLKKFRDLEEEFENGVEGRTKFEVSNMKKEWEKMNRLYEGVKTMQKFPKAVVVVDVNFERKVIVEAKRLNIPVVAIVDTNSDPELVDYPIPGNDDAISSLKLLLKELGTAVKKGNKGKGVKHEFVDYSKFEVKILKTEVEKVEQVEVGKSEPTPKAEARIDKSPAKGKKKVAEEAGVLENIQKQKETKRQVEASAEREQEK